MGDQQASLFGHRCFERGQVKCTFGTGSFLVSNTGETRFDSNNGLISTVFYQKEKGSVYYALEGSIYNSGSILKWLKENLGLLKSYDDIDKLASGIDYQSRMYLVPSMTGLGAPYWDPGAGALLIGFDRSTSSNEILRAAVEAAAYRTHDVIIAMERDSGNVINEIKIDGGVSRSNLFCKILADITGKRIIRSTVRETTSLGIFFGAGLAIGLWHSEKEINVKDNSAAFHPEISSGKRKLLYGNWKRALKRSLDWHKAD